MMEVARASIVLPKEVMDKLKNIASKNMMFSVSDVIRIAIKEYLDKVMDEYGDGK